nr:DUF485 domain-containing protein [uncultured Cupriavidus sp.]
MSTIYSSVDDLSSREEMLTAIGVRRQRVSLGATVLILCIYFSFVIVVAYFKSILVVQLVPGLSIAIAAGVATIIIALLITFVYVIWINCVHDVSMHAFEGKVK